MASAELKQLVAVITSSFQVIREESKTSAFTTDELCVVSTSGCGSGINIL